MSNFGERNTGSGRNNLYEMNGSNSRGSSGLKRKPGQQLIQEDHKKYKRSHIQDSDTVSEESYQSEESNHNTETGLGSRILKFVNRFITPKKKEDEHVEMTSTETKKLLVKEINISPFLQRNHQQISDMALEYNMNCEFVNNKMVLKGESFERIGDLLTHLNDLEASYSDQKLKKYIEEFRKKEMIVESPQLTSLINPITNNEPRVEKVIEPKEANEAQNSDVHEQIRQLKQSILLLESKIQPSNKEAGNSKPMIVISEYKEEFESEPYQDSHIDIEKEVYESIEFQQPPKQNANIIKKQIPLSASIRLSIEEVRNKAKDLELTVDFSYDHIFILGVTDKINEFIAYIGDLELQKKKEFYLSAWDFNEKCALALIPVLPNTEEYKARTEAFLKNMPEMKVIRLTRIQNNFLMQQHFSTIQQIQEKRQPENIKRFWSYYGTGNLAPEIICSSPGTGFDKKYADNTTSGGYGKGFRFFGKAKNCHLQSAYRTPEGTYQLLITMTFFGKGISLPKGDYLQAPAGYDHIQGEDVKVVYESFYAYPYYLIEYK